MDDSGDRGPIIFAQRIGLFLQSTYIASMNASSLARLICATVFLLLPQWLVASEHEGLPADAVTGDAEVTDAAELEIIDAGTEENRQLRLDDYLWVSRPIIVLADTPNDPRLEQQMSMLESQPEPLIERDVVILIDANPSAKSTLRTELRPRGFMLVLIGKDGGVKLRKPFPWSVREISRAIDKMPFRQQEMRNR